MMNFVKIVGSDRTKMLNTLQTNPKSGFHVTSKRSNIDNEPRAEIKCGLVTNR